MVWGRHTELVTSCGILIMVCFLFLCLLPRSTEVLVGICTRCREAAKVYASLVAKQMRLFAISAYVLLKIW